MADKTSGFWFDEKKHMYYLDGKKMTGTTTILNVLAKPQLIQWAANLAAAMAYGLQCPEDFAEALEQVIAKYGKLNSNAVRELDARFPDFKAARTEHTKKKEAAGAHGTDYHAMVEDYVKGCITLHDGTPYGHLDVSPILPFVNWAMENVDTFLFSERKMHDPELFYAGTADFGYIGKDGKRYMGDFKTSSGIYGIEYWLQCAAYRYLAELEGDAPYDGMTITRMGKDDGVFEVQSVYEYEMFRDTFLACLKIYRAQAATEDLIVKQD